MTDPRSKLKNLQPRLYLVGQPEDLVHLDWSDLNKECVVEFEERKQKQACSEAIDALLRLRREQAPVSDQEISRARKADRP